MLIILAILFILAALFFGLEYYVFSRIFKPAKRKKDDATIAKIWRNDEFTDRINELENEVKNYPCIFLHTRSLDGVRLSARYYHVADGAPLVISFHGFHGSATRDNCGTAAHHLKKGRNLLLVDERAQNRSEGRAITFGIKERFDVKAWCDYATTRFGEDTDITVQGISLGGATVLMAAGEELPKTVKRIAADCPYSSPRDVIAYSMTLIHYPPKIFIPLAKIAARLFGGFDLFETTAALEAKKARVPMLIIHGEADTLVPESMSEVIAEDNPLVERHTFFGADHGMSFLTDPERYIAILEDFIARTSEAEKPPKKAEDPTAEYFEEA